jgi:TolB-like protein
MAPEQARGMAVDQRADVFSFGVVLYEMLAGQRPFRGATATDTVAAILKEQPPPLPASVPPDLVAVIGKCLAKVPEKRYSSGSEVLAALGGVDVEGAAPLWGSLQRSVRRHPWLAAANAVVALAVLALALDAGGVRSRLLGRGNGGQAIRMAVLPFANLSGGPEQDYLSDGLTQEMIAQLGRLHPDTLSVIARTSVMRYKKTEAPIDQIGRELGVEYVLEGSAQREGSRVRITAELIRVRGQTQLWADSFEREMSGILALQSDVARNVASALALKLLPAEKTSLANVRSVNAEAYELYLRGLQQRDTLTAAGLDAAQRYFELALAKDTDFALAYAGIANVWACRAQMEITPPREAGPKAKAAALKAMALDDTIAAVHASMGGILAWIDWDWVGAERELRRAIEAGPDTMGARAMYSHVLMIVGRPDEAMPQIERAVELDPFNVLTLSFYTMSLYCERRYDEAIAQARKALSMQPDSGGALSELILALHETKQHDEMIAAAKKLYAGWYPDVGQALERGYAGRDYPGAWRRAAEFEAAKHGGDPGAAYDIAQGALYAGDTARALDWLERACDDRDPNLPYITCEPLWDPVRSDPRFQALLRRMNLPVK